MGILDILKFIAEHAPRSYPLRSREAVAQARGREHSFARAEAARRERTAESLAAKSKASAHAGAIAIAAESVQENLARALRSISGVECPDVAIDVSNPEILVDNGRWPELRVWGRGTITHRSTHVTASVTYTIGDGASLVGVDGENGNFNPKTEDGIQGLARVVESAWNKADLDRLTRRA